MFELTKECRELFQSSNIDQARIDFATDCAYVLRWATSDGKVDTDCTTGRWISPGEIHKSSRFSAGKKMRVDAVLEMLWKLGITYDYCRTGGDTETVLLNSKRVIKKGRPKLMILVDDRWIANNQAVSADPHTADELELFLCRQLVAKFKKRDARDMIASAEERVKNGEKVEQAGSGILNTNTSRNWLRVVSPIVLPDCTRFEVGHIVTDLPTIKHMLLNKYPVVRANEPITYFNCTFCGRAHDKSLFTDKEEGPFALRPKKSFLALLETGTFHFDSSNVIEDKHTIREILKHPECYPVNMVWKGKDFMHCPCSKVFFITEQMRRETDVFPNFDIESVQTEP